MNHPLPQMAVLALLAGCHPAAAPPHAAATPSPAPAATAPTTVATPNGAAGAGASRAATSQAATAISADERIAAVERIGELLDAWHAAAARADFEGYFGRMTEDAVFLGTDASERWDRHAFEAYAKPHFHDGKAWSFRATRRSVMIVRDGSLAWFDEDLATPNLGPARGSGVVRRVADRWRIAHYNLTITVPNERFGEVKALLEGTPCSVCKSQACTSALKPPPPPRPPPPRPHSGELVNPFHDR
jgi:ketosteroid isomerase-like protein